LHSAAAAWYAQHGYPVEAIRHGQAAQNPNQAARPLPDHWTGLDPKVDAQGATGSGLLTKFPATAVTAAAELAVLRAADELNSGWLEEAERHLARAAQGLASIPVDQCERLRVMLAIVCISLAWQRDDLPAIVAEAQRLLARAETPDAAQPGHGAELRALALISLGIAEFWSIRGRDTGEDPERSLGLVHRVERPYLDEVSSLAHWVLAASLRSFARAVEPGMQAIELVRQHDWTQEPMVAFIYLALGATTIWQGRLEETERWLDHAERGHWAGTHPTARLVLHFARGLAEMARGRGEEAMVAFRAAERLAELTGSAYLWTAQIRAFMLPALVRLGGNAHVEQALAELDEQERGTGQMCCALAVLRLAQDNPQAATAALEPVLDGSASLMNLHVWVIQAFLLEAIAREALGDPADAGRALEQALDVAEPDGILLPFLLYPATRLLEHHARQRTTHTALVSEILNLLAGARRPESPTSKPQRLREPLSDSETRVLRYLPTNLSAPKIASELSVSVNTVRTHLYHLYAKLGAHSRGEAVDRACAFGLLAQSPHRP
jgi:LuxR family maltose regulon positive regulatory protein